ncbi:TIGR03618 family F420-dependent PPOX class oxidoreductase [Auraticoccus sp. F435]|uniref:TIGR03618 family F420-dependent PPOX class oxidoreductase n=1 Tax=Auraticoccus cholistanensis TaxID=2656650 RepID=A0A6A9UTX1_9ACTN|nr:PPOX class F420-dependent oxidoreductase [Auraticoccus cholistanensis]MVA75102.1 TIGR03618 family F420-dependent PPOX class oxidoreductase [Auraticoccus cholistanensis]
MSELDPALLALFGEQRTSVLATLRRNGRPQLSNVLHAWDPRTATARISVTADRAKTRNAARDPRASLHVTSSDFWSYAVLEGDAELGPVATEPGDEGVRQLVELYRTLRGEHPDWEDYTRAMIAERRQVLSVRAQHVYGSVR